MRESLSLLLEKTRRELLSKQKREAPKRVKRADSYSINNAIIDANALINNWLIITTTISGNGHSYTCVIAFEKVMNDLIEEAKRDYKHVVNAKLIQKSIKQSLDNNDVFIDCNCPDFKYTYAYFATQGKFKWGKLQNSNGKEIRNPNNQLGTMCKHLYALLRSNNFMNYVSDKIFRVIMGNLDILVKKFNINLEEFIINSKAYDKLLKANITRDKSGRFKSKTDSSNDKTSNEESNKENVDDNDSQAES